MRSLDGAPAVASVTAAQNKALCPPRTFGGSRCRPGEWGSQSLFPTLACEAGEGRSARGPLRTLLHPGDSGGTLSCRTDRISITARGAGTRSRRGRAEHSRPPRRRDDRPARHRCRRTNRAIGNVAHEKTFCSYAPCCAHLPPPAPTACSPSARRRPRRPLPRPRSLPTPKPGVWATRSPFSLMRTPSRRRKAATSSSNSENLNYGPGFGPMLA